MVTSTKTISEYGQDKSNDAVVKAEIDNFEREALAWRSGGGLGDDFRPFRLQHGTYGQRQADRARRDQPRRRHDASDLWLAAELASDGKENAEHTMLVDLARNDLGRVAASGTVEVTALKEIERYSHVMHLVSTVEGVLPPHASQFALFRSAFPAGTVTGAPKIRAMEILSELEGASRGPYAGAVGYFGVDGGMDQAIAIRTIAFHEGRFAFQAGAGIVADSEPEREHAEVLSKSRALSRALELAEEPL